MNNVHYLRPEDKAIVEESPTYDQMLKSHLITILTQYALGCQRVDKIDLCAADEFAEIIMELYENEY